VRASAERIETQSIFAWLVRVGSSTVLEIEIREPSTKHAISINQVEQWLVWRDG
jgi:hypothetical protein